MSANQPLNDFSSPLDRQQIVALCRRGFGNDVEPVSVRPLTGGTFNETYLLELNDGSHTVLRVAPPNSDVYWDDEALMRRELAVLPYFASVASLMPRVLMADFTHLLVGRDYMFQSFVAGERWSDIEDELTSEENQRLWHQCGAIVRNIHDTTGEAFGYPVPCQPFASWRGTVLARAFRLAADLNEHPVDLSGFSAIVDILSVNAAIMDEIDQPCLLHGDLWTFNLLITRGDDGAAITGLLDADRAWWGDPMADWIMFLLDIRQDEPGWREPIAAFDAGYGPFVGSDSTRFRREIYKAMHITSSVLWQLRNGDTEDIGRARREYSEIAKTLHMLTQ